MNANEINAVIDKICEKLGIAVQSVDDLVPSITKMEIIGNVCGIVGFSILGAVFAVFAIKMWNEKSGKGVTEEYEFMFFALCVICTVISVWLSYLVMVRMERLIKWIIVPDAQAVVWLMNQIGGA